MVETGSRRFLLGPAAIAVLLLVVAGVVAVGGRGDAGRPSRAADGGPMAATTGCGSAPALTDTAKPAAFTLNGAACAIA